MALLLSATITTPTATTATTPLQLRDRSSARYMALQSTFAFGGTSGVAVSCGVAVYVQPSIDGTACA